MLYGKSVFPKLSSTYLLIVTSAKNGETTRKFVFLKEQLTGLYLVALSLMIAGVVFAVADTIVRSHIHKHHHFLTHTHDGSTHTHEIIHSHGHNHYVTDSRHGHHHSQEDLEKDLLNEHNP